MAKEIEKVEKEMHEEVKVLLQKAIEKEEEARTLRNAVGTVGTGTLAYALGYGVAALGPFGIAATTIVAVSSAFGVHQFQRSIEIYQDNLKLLTILADNCRNVKFVLMRSKEKIQFGCKYGFDDQVKKDIVDEIAREVLRHKESFGVKDKFEKN